MIHGIEERHKMITFSVGSVGNRNGSKIALAFIGAFLFLSVTNGSAAILLRLLGGAAGRGAATELLAARSTAIAVRASTGTTAGRGGLWRVRAQRTPFFELESIEITSGRYAFRGAGGEVLYTSSAEGGVIRHFAKDGKQFGYSVHLPELNRVKHFRIQGGREELLGHDELISSNRIRHFDKDEIFAGESQFSLSERDAADGLLMALAFAAAGAGDPTNSQATAQVATELSATAVDALPVQQVNGMHVQLSSLEILDDEVSVVLEFTNSTKSAQAIALKAQHSDGIADFWKFFPASEGYLSDQQGRKFQLLSAKGLPWGKTSDDWVLIHAGQKHTSSLSFERSSGSVGNQFNLNVELWVVWRNQANALKKQAFTLFFKDVRGASFIKKSK